MTENSASLPLALPGPDGAVYALSPTLVLVQDMENICGNVFSAATKLVARDLPLGMVLALLQAAYRAAGCMLTVEALAAFLLEDPPTRTTQLLAEVLTRIIAPLQALGVAAPAEGA